MHRAHTAQEQLITSVAGEYGAVLETAQKLINGATRSIDIVHARRPSAADQAARRSDRVERELLRTAADGVAIRLLTTPALLDVDFVREQFGRERPVAVRVARIPPLQALTVDGVAAFVVAESPVGRRCSVVREPEVLRTLQAFFQSVWSDATPAGDSTAFDGRGPRPPCSGRAGERSHRRDSGPRERRVRADLPAPCRRGDGVPRGEFPLPGRSEGRRTRPAPGLAPLPRTVLRAAARTAESAGPTGTRAARGHPADRPGACHSRSRDRSAPPDVATLPS